MAYAHSSFFCYSFEYYFSRIALIEKCEQVLLNIEVRYLNLIWNFRMLRPQKKQNISLQELNSKGSIVRGRWRKEKTSGPSIFISKTYEILEVCSHTFRMIYTQISPHGIQMELISLFLMWKDSNNRFYPSTLDIKTFHLSLDSSTCMIFTKFVMN